VQTEIEVDKFFGLVDLKRVLLVFVATLCCLLLLFFSSLTTLRHVYVHRHWADCAAVRLTWNC